LKDTETTGVSYGYALLLGAYNARSWRRQGGRVAPAVGQLNLLMVSCGGQSRPRSSDTRILLHHLPRGLLIGCVEDDQASVDRSQGRAGEDKLAAGQQALQPAEMLCPDGLLIGCHRRSEVIARRVDEVNPFRHGPSLPVHFRIVNPVLSRDADSMSKREQGSCPACAR